MKSPDNIDFSRIPDHLWEFEGYSLDGYRLHYRYWIDRDKGVFVRKVENLAEPDLVASNRQRYDDSFGQRFGDGRVVASIPLNKFYSELAPRIRDGDKDHMKWWLNREENRPWRSFRGKI